MYTLTGQIQLGGGGGGGEVILRRFPVKLTVAASIAADRHCANSRAEPEAHSSGIGRSLPTSCLLLRRPLRS